MSRTPVLVAAGLLAAVAASGCTLSSDPASDSVGRLQHVGSGHAEEEGGKLLPADPDAATLTINAPAVSVKFEPNKLDTEAGVVNIQFKTDGQHNFVLVGKGFTEPVLWGHKFGGAVDETNAIELTDGEYQFYCSVPGHKEAGMRGVLVAK